MYIVSHAPIHPRREQVWALLDALPELGRLDVDWLELALDLIPHCVLAWRAPAKAAAVVAALAGAGLAVEALGRYDLRRAWFGCPAAASPGALLEVTFIPTFNPSLVVRASPAAGGGGPLLELWTCRGDPDEFPLSGDHLQALELDVLPPLEVIRGGGRIGEGASAPLLAAIAALARAADRVEEVNGRDGMDVELRLTDADGRPRVDDVWSPDPARGPRTHACAAALLRACAGLALEPALAARVREVARYL